MYRGWIRDSVTDCRETFIRPRRFTVSTHGCLSNVTVNVSRDAVTPAGAAEALAATLRTNHSLNERPTRAIPDDSQSNHRRGPWMPAARETATTRSENERAPTSRGRCTRCIGREPEKPESLLPKFRSGSHGRSVPIFPRP